VREVAVGVRGEAGEAGEVTGEVVAVRGKVVGVTAEAGGAAGEAAGVSEVAVVVTAEVREVAGEAAGVTREAGVLTARWGVIGLPIRQRGRRRLAWRSAGSPTGPPRRPGSTGAAEDGTGPGPVLPVPEARAGR
jgi:hypothetical protein